MTLPRDRYARVAPGTRIFRRPLHSEPYWSPPAARTDPQPETRSRLITAPRPSPHQPLLQPLIKIVALIVHHDERGEILHLDPPDRLHPEFRILQHLHLPNAVQRPP